jgi:hypothetical protein
MSIALITAGPHPVGNGAPLRPLVTPFRACELCRHSIAHSERLMCDSPAVHLVGRPEALELARSATGSCGPNARHLDMPGWH